MPEFTKEYLAELQALPLEVKIAKSKLRIREWYYHFGGKVCVSFSGGKDSTVLLHLVRSVFPDVPAVFSDTGLEYPEIRKFAMNHEAVEVIRPKMVFDQVITKYGYPLVTKQVSFTIYYARRNEEREGIKNARLKLLGKYKNEYANKDTGEIMVCDSRFNTNKWLSIAEKAPFRISHRCCAVTKKSPLHSWEAKTKLKPYIGTLAEESELRKIAWMKRGCNAFDSNDETSQPLSFWTEQDVLQYIERFNIPICSVYGDIVWMDKNFQYAMPEAPGAKLTTTGADRTGCVFCGFGMHLEKGESRFQRLKRTHPRLYEYAIGGGNG